MQRLNADYATLSQLNPRLVYCSLSGFGQDGPYRDRPAHDLNYLAISGVLNLIGEVGRAPAIPLNIIADYGGAAMHGVVGILLALFARHRTGRGQHVDVAYLDATLSLLAATPCWPMPLPMVSCRNGAMAPTRACMPSTPPTRRKTVAASPLAAANPGSGTISVKPSVALTWRATTAVSSTSPVRPP